MARKHYRAFFLAWAGLFLYVLADDAFRLHEQGGEFLARALNIIYSWFILRGTDYGEILFFVLAGMVFFGAIVVTFYPHRKDDVLKEIFRNLVYLLVVLAVFGIIADAAHILALVAAKLWSWLRPLWILLFFLSGALEDGGEMLVVSVTLWYVFLLHGRLTTKVTANDTV